MKQLILVLILFLLASVPVQAGWNCVSKFECVDTCGWQNSPPNLQIPVALYHLFYEPDGNWGSWSPQSSMSCKDAYKKFAWPRCGNAKDIPKSITADCHECLTSYTQENQENCCKDNNTLSICPAEVDQQTQEDLRRK